MFAKLKTGVSAAVLSLSTTAAMALPPDYSTLTDAIDFSTASEAVLAGLVLLAGFGLTIKGATAVMRALGIKK